MIVDLIASAEYLIAKGYTSNQCHAIKDEVKDGYLPGANLERYYSMKMPILLLEE